MQGDEPIAVDELVGQFKLPARTFYALADTTQGFRLVNSRYRTIADISQNLASRDLAHLCQLGLLEAHGERRGRFYTASAITKEIRAKTREPRVPIPDPFDNPAAATQPAELESLKAQMLEMQAGLKQLKAARAGTDVGEAPARRPVSRVLSPRPSSRRRRSFL